MRSWPLWLLAFLMALLSPSVVLAHSGLAISLGAVSSFLLGAAVLGVGVVLAHRAGVLPLAALAAIVVYLPDLALAQDVIAVEPEPGGFFGFSAAQIAMYVALALAVIELAKRVAAIIPGKRDDEIVGVIDGLVRKLVDFLAGKTGKPEDPSLVKRGDG